MQVTKIKVGEAFGYVDSFIYKTKTGWASERNVVKRHKDELQAVEVLEVRKKGDADPRWADEKLAKAKVKVRYLDLDGNVKEGARAFWTETRNILACWDECRDLAVEADKARQEAKAKQARGFKAAEGLRKALGVKRGQGDVTSYTGGVYLSNCAAEALVEWIMQEQARRS